MELRQPEASVKSRFPDGFRILKGKQEYITYVDHSSIRIWASALATHYDTHMHSAIEIIMPYSGASTYQLADETYEVRRGILCHSGPELPETLEGQIVRLSDRIAYINHDIDDAVRAGILKNEDIPRDLAAVLGETHSQRINTLVSDVVNSSRNRPVIAMTPAVEAAMLELREFMFERVYRNPVAKGEEVKARRIIQELYKYYLEHPEKLPQDFQPQLDMEGLPRVVCDYVAGMTDKYAVYKFEEIFVPSGWAVR